MNAGNLPSGWMEQSGALGSPIDQVSQRSLTHPTIGAWPGTAGRCVPRHAGTKTLSAYRHAPF
jgi:hypothetical protein